jgi:hypothetical protein
LLTDIIRVERFFNGVRLPMHVELEKAPVDGWEKGGKVYIGSISSLKDA